MGDERIAACPCEFQFPFGRSRHRVDIVAVGFRSAGKRMRESEEAEGFVAVCQYVTGVRALGMAAEMFWPRTNCKLLSYNGL